MNNINDQDKLMAALAWVFTPIVPIIILVVPSMSERPFQKYHAINALAFAVILFILIFILAVCTFWIGGLGACLGLLPGLAIFYFAFQAYQGEAVEIPGITNFLKGQGWI